MKKRMLALLLAGLLLCTTGCHKATLEDFKLFRSSPLGFSIEYPDFWQKETDVSEGIAVFVTPAEGYSDEYRDSFSVQRFTLDMEGENAFNEYIQGYVQNLEQTLKNYKLVSQDDITFGGEDAYQIVYESTTDDGESQLRVLQIFAQKGEKVYVASYMADFSSYSYFLTDVEKMLSTFAFLG